jgi:hypothetical protein
MSLILPRTIDVSVLVLTCLSRGMMAWLPKVVLAPRADFRVIYSQPLKMSAKTSTRFFFDGRCDVRLQRDENAMRDSRLRTGR